MASARKRRQKPAAKPGDGAPVDGEQLDLLEYAHHRAMLEAGRKLAALLEHRERCEQRAHVQRKAVAKFGCGCPACAVAWMVADPDLRCRAELELEAQPLARSSSSSATRSSSRRSAA